MRDLGYVRIQARIADPDECSAELIEISENLHRSDLSELDRSVMMARWVQLTMMNLNSTQVVSKSKSPDNPKGAGRPPSGIREAAKALGIGREDARRAVKIASLSPEAKKLAKHMKLHDNQAALLFCDKLSDHALKAGRMAIRAYRMMGGCAGPSYAP